MKVLKLVPGSGGGFYCENCMRDSSLTAALREEGVDVTMLPMYLPVMKEAELLSGDVPVFFGGINVYLQQQFPVFRKTPGWIDRMFDSRLMLKLASHMEHSTKAHGLGAMTLSMIDVEEGNQRKELARLLRWLATQEKPDLVHITTVMLIGLARPIQAAIGVPVVCSTMDEDVWIDALDGDYPTRCWQAMHDRSEDVAAIIAVSDWYRDIMQRRLEAPAGKVHTVHVGVDTKALKRAPLAFAPPTLGYLSKQCKSLGLDTLVAAYLELRKTPGLEQLRLEAFGGVIGPDKAFIETLRRKLAAAGCARDVTFHTSMEREDKLRFLEGIDVMCVPMKGGEAFGTFIAESWMAGVPVVVPSDGAFPELLSLTDGGVLYNGHSVTDVVQALKRVLCAPDYARALGAAGYDYAREHLTVRAMARATIEIYQNAIEAHYGD